ncbi:MAG: chemotaxis protein CheB [Cyanophyceae cyanobacterium]
MAIAASVGGLNAISRILSDLPANFTASILIVQHLDPKHRSLMAEILRRKTDLVVKQAEVGDRLKPGVVYIAPPNYHLQVDSGGVLSLSQTKLMNFVRPSADILFNSVAVSYGSRAIAVVLTGAGKDGGAGIQKIHELGGIAIAQDEGTAECFSMPSAAIKTGAINFVLPLNHIALKLISLVMSNNDSSPIG